MADRSKPTPERPDLKQLIVDAAEKFRALPKDKQSALRRAQRKSWVIGEMLLAHPEMTRDEAEQLYNSIIF